jgi:uncharacterized protein (DUF433 family)
MLDRLTAGLSHRFLRKWAKLAGQEGNTNDMATSVIVRNPGILGGEPIFRGTRVPFRSLADYIEHGRTLNEFLEDFPSVTFAEAIAAPARGADESC